MKDDLRYSPWYLRVLSGVLDLLAVAALLMLGTVIVRWVHPLLTPEALENSGATLGCAESIERSRTVTRWPVASMLLIAVLLALVNTVVVQGWTGRSLGKSATGQRLVDSRARRPIGVGRAFVRQLAHIADALPCCLGFLWPLVDEQRRTFADMLTNTVVVRGRLPVGDLPPREKAAATRRDTPAPAFSGQVLPSPSSEAVTVPPAAPTGASSQQRLVGTGPRGAGLGRPVMPRFPRRGLLAGAALVVPAIGVTATAVALRPWDRTVTGKPSPETDGPIAGVVAEWTSDIFGDPVLFSVDGSRIAGGRQVWDVETRHPTGQVPRGRVIRALHPGGETMAVDEWLVLRLVDGSSGDSIGPPCIGHTDRISAVVFHPDGRLFSCSWDGTIRVWDAFTGQQIGPPLTDHNARVDSIALGPDGKVLASAGWDNTVRLWNADAGRPIGQPFRVGERAGVVAFGVDGNTLISGHDNGRVRFWDVGRHLESAGAPTGPTGVELGVQSIAASPDGARFATAHFDGTVRLWDAGTRTMLGRPFTAHSGPVMSVAFSPAGTLLASGGEDRFIRLWTLSPHR